MKRRILRILAVTFLTMSCALWAASYRKELAVRWVSQPNWYHLGVAEGSLFILKEYVGDNCLEDGYVGLEISLDRLSIKTEAAYTAQWWFGLTYIRGGTYAGPYWIVAIPIWSMLLVAIPLARDLCLHRRKRGSGFPVVQSENPSR